MIGQSMINVNSGGRGRLSGISAAIFLLLCILFGSKYIEMIPLAALVGVMFMVVLSTFEWSCIRIVHKMPRADAFVVSSCVRSYGVYRPCYCCSGRRISVSPGFCVEKR